MFSKAKSTKQMCSKAKSTKNVFFKSTKHVFFQGQILYTLSTSRAVSCWRKAPFRRCDVAPARDRTGYETLERVGVGAEYVCAYELT